MDKDFYKTEGVFSENADNQDSAEEFLDALWDIDLFELDISNEFTYFGHADVGLKYVETNTLESGEVEKLFELQFQVLSYDGDFVKIRTIHSVDDDDDISEYFYYDSEGNEHPADSDNFEEFMSDLAQ
jgi:hypothetical protein